jgi:hypothetical protein
MSLGASKLSLLVFVVCLVTSYAFRCTPLTACAEVGVEYEEIAPTYSSDRVCSTVLKCGLDVPTHTEVDGNAGGEGDKGVSIADTVGPQHLVLQSASVCVGISRPHFRSILFMDAIGSFIRAGGPQHHTCVPTNNLSGASTLPDHPFFCARIFGLNNRTQHRTSSTS